MDSARCALLSPNGSFLSARGAQDWLIERYREGRPIVPLLGTGISVDAGIPPLTGVTRYLALVHAYILEGIFRSTRKVENRSQDSRYSRRPWEYLRDHGWPEPNQMVFEIWLWLERAFPEIPFNRRLDHLVDWAILDNLKQQDGPFVGKVESLSRLALGESAIVDWSFRGDHWQGLLERLTRSDPDLVDAMFQRLVQGRSPGQAQRYLAYLSPVLNLRLYMTTNFDTLLEDSLNREGLPATVWEVADGSPLPFPGLLRGQRAVVKLHGGRYRLLWDGRLNSPLDKESIHRLVGYLPRRAILLVLGLGGWDARILDLLESATEVEDEDRSIVWMHFESGLPRPVQERFSSGLGSGEGRRLVSCRYAGPGVFLQELYERLTRSHPSIRRAYRAYDHRPSIMPADGKSDGGDRSENEVGDLSRQEEATRFSLFVDGEQEAGLGASKRLAEFVTRLGHSHLPVWVDLESKHSIEHVLADLLEQLRRYDPTLPPEIIPAEQTLGGRHGKGGHHPRDFAKSVRRVLSALSRGRYVVAFDGVASFGRSPVEHHMGSEAVNSNTVADRDLGFFLELCRKSQQGEDPRVNSVPGTIPRLKDSYIGISIGKRRQAGRDVGRVLKLEANLLALCDRPDRTKGPSTPADRVTALLNGRLAPDLENGLCFLSAFRIRRSHVVLSTLGGKYGIEDPDDPVRWTGRFHELEGVTNALLRLQDGSWWMGRGFRNRVYEHFDSLARGRRHRRDPRRRLFASVLLASVHRDLGRYYVEAFISSRDPSLLSEALFHRLALLRLLVRLETWLRTGSVAPLHLSGAQADRLRNLEGRTHRRGTYRLFFGAIELSEADSKGSHAVVLHRDQMERAARQCLNEISAFVVREATSFRAYFPAVSLLQWTRALRALVEALEEGALSAEAKAFGKELAELEIEVHADRYDLANTLSLGTDYLESLLGGVKRAVDPMRSVDDWQRALDSGRIRVARGWTLRDLKVLFQMARVWRRSPEGAKGAAFRDVFEKAVDRYERAHGSDPLVAALRYRLRADWSFLDTSPWDAKGQSHGVFKALKKRARATERYAELAISELASVHEDHRDVVSYLRSLAGRALAVRSMYQQRDALSRRAHSMFDLSRAGMTAYPATRREALAVSLLRLAESTMLRADDLLLQRLVAEHEERLVMFDLSSSLAKDPWSKNVPVEHLLRQSMGFWAPEVLNQTKLPSRELITGSWQRLNRTEELLDSAQQVLELTHRVVEWWACLFQLRTQLEVERLLLMSTGREIVGHSRDQGPHLFKRRFIQRFRSSLRRGLLGVRLALDVLLPEVSERTVETLSKDRRTRRVVRLWLELMVCGGELSALSMDAEKRQHLRGEVLGSQLWDGWVELNQLAGIVKLPRSCPVKKWVRAWAQKWDWAPIDFAEDEVRWGNRGRVIAAIDDCLRHEEPRPPRAWFGFLPSLGRAQGQGDGATLTESLLEEISKPE